MTPQENPMIEHTGLPVAGYQPQSQERVDRVNANKQAEERILRTIEDLRLDCDVDVRWLAVAKTHIEQGFMALNRAVFQPGRIKLDGE